MPGHASFRNRLRQDSQFQCADWMNNKEGQDPCMSICVDITLYLQLTSWFRSPSFKSFANMRCKCTTEYRAHRL